MERALQLDPFNNKIQDKVLELRHIVDNLPSACTPEPTVEIIEIQEPSTVSEETVIIEPNSEDERPKFCVSIEN
jgi:hypothetical protein